MVPASCVMRGENRVSGGVGVDAECAAKPPAMQAEHADDCYDPVE